MSNFNRQFLGFVFLLMPVLDSSNLWATCKFSSEYAFSGTDSGENIFGRQYKDGINIDDGDSCRFLSANCSYEHVLSEQNIEGGPYIDYGTLIHSFSISNDESGGSWSSTALINGNNQGSSKSGYTGSKIDELYNEWLTETLALEAKNPLPTRYTMVKKVCEIVSSFLLSDSSPAEENAPAKQCKAVPDPVTNTLGSIINVRDRSVGQSIPISGTNLNISYTTDNTSGSNGYGRAFTLKVPGNRPYPTYNGQWELTDVTLDVTIAGVHFTKTFLDSEIDSDYGASYTVPWDGKDLNGVTVVGPVIAEYTTTYNFATSWDSTPEILVHSNQILLGSIDFTNAFKMGGWSLDNYHFYSAVLKTVYLGTGYRMTTEALALNSNGQYEIPSTDGSLIYTFSSTGAHLSTRDSVSGVVLETFQQNSSGFLISITDRDGLVTLVNRDSSNNLTSIVNPYGVTTTFDMDVAGNLYEINDPINRSYKFYYLNGLPNAPMSAMRNPDGNTKYYSYDLDGKILTATNAKGGIKSFDGLSTMDSQQLLESNTLTSPMGRVKTFESARNFDKTLMIRTTDSSGFQTTQTRSEEVNGQIVEDDSTGTSIQTTIEKSKRFKDQSVIKQIVDSSSGGGVVDFDESYAFPDVNNPLVVSEVIKTAKSNNQTTTSNYNVANKLLTKTSPLGYQNLVTYDSKFRPISTQYSNLLPIEFTYNSSGQLTTLTQGTRTYNFDYNGLGQLSSVTDPLSNVNQFTYNDSGELLTQTLPNNKSYLYTYTDNGQLSTITNASNNQYYYDYDENFNPVLNTEPSIGSAGFSWEWAYNDDDQTTTVTHPDASLLSNTYNSDGTLASMSAPGLTRTFTWSNGVLQSIGATSNVNLNLYGDQRPTLINWQGAVNGSVEYSWGNLGKLQGLTVNSSNNIYFNYDDNDDLIQAGDLAFTRNVVNGSITQSTLGQMTTTHSYSSYGEESQTSVTKNGVDLIEFQYTRDDLGRITNVAKILPGGTTNTSYTYDSIGQLTSETTGGVTKTYTYTDNGNRLTSTGAEVYDAQDRLVSNSEWNFTYNKNGYLSRKDHVSNGAWVTYTYDVLGNLLVVQNSNAVKVDYLVDGLDRRVRRRLNNSFSAAFLYQDDLRPVAQLKSNGTVKSMFVYGSKANVPDLVIQGGVSYRIISDYLGSVLYVIKTTNGQIMQQMTYDTWGKVLTDSNPGFQPFGFAGGIYDSTTGLVRFGARDYDASIGRWLNKDPLRQVGGYNLYVYANNNPINFIDVEGKAPKGIWGTPLSTDDNCELVGGIIGATAAFASAGPVGVANGFVIATLGGQVGQRIGKGISSMIPGGCGGAGIIGPEWKTGKPTSPTERCNINPSRSINGAPIPMSTGASIRPGW